MEAAELSIGLDRIGTVGFTLSPEQRSALQVSLPLLKKEHNFVRVTLWGKVLGTVNDLLIAQGHEQSFTFSAKRNFVSYVLLCILGFVSHSAVTMGVSSGKS